MRRYPHSSRSLHSSLAGSCFAFCLLSGAGAAQSPATPGQSGFDGQVPADPILKARAFLEGPTVRQTVLQALHLLASDAGQTCAGEPQRGIQGFALVCQFKWRYLSAAVAVDTVTFRFDPSGNFISVGDATSTGRLAPFGVTNWIVGQIKDAGVDAVVDQIFSGTEQSRRQQIEKWVATKAAEAAVPRPDVRTLLSWILAGLGQPGGEAMVAESAMPRVMRPTAGVDGFNFAPAAATGLPFSGTADQFAVALPDLIAKASAARSIGLPDYAADSVGLANAVRACAQITPHLAISVSDNGGYGREHVSRLGNQFAVCEGSPVNGVGDDPGDPQTRRIVFTLSPPRGNGWKDGRAFTVAVRFSALRSDPAPAPARIFDTYGIVLATILPAPLVCQRMPGGAVPADQVWRQDGTNLSFRVHFDCDYAEVYAAGNNQLVTDLALKPDAGNSRKDKYVGTGLLSPCAGGRGKVEIRKMVRVPY
jgi:hypothetical protein